MGSDRLRLLIADDEPLARGLMRRYASAEEDIEVAAECANGDELAAALSAGAIDVAFVDIRMPGRGVFQVLADAASLPWIVFSTAFDEYAVRAFEMNAVDYLVKPYAVDRFAEAMRRVRDRRGGAQRAAAGVPVPGLAQVIRDLGPHPDRLLVPDGRRMVPVALTDIVWIQAEDDYARIHTAGKSYLIARRLKDLEVRLPADDFVRIHRSAIVHAAHIREVSTESGSRLRVRLSDGTSVLVSRSRAGALRRWMI